jgi:hypothetical protein
MLEIHRKIWWKWQFTSSNVYKKDSLFSYTGTNHLLAIVVKEISK